MAGCGDVLSLEDLQTAKKHQIFEAEVITGKAGGVAGGAYLPEATNPVTGQVQTTLPEIIADAEAEFAQSAAGMAFARVGTFSSGATLDDMREVLLWDIANGGDGHEYGWTGAFLKVVPPSSSPASTGGVGAGAWVDRTDATLRSELAAPGGAGLIGSIPQPVTSPEFAGGADPTGAALSDAAFAAAAGSTSPVSIPDGIYNLSADVQGDFLEGTAVTYNGTGRAVPKKVGFWADQGPVRIHRLRDRVLVGNAVLSDGKYAQEDSSFLTNAAGYGWLERAAQMHVSHTTGGSAIIGSSRTSDKVGTVGQTCIGLASYAWADGTAGSAWGAYVEAVRSAGVTTNIFGMELTAKNLDTDSAVTSPYNIFSQGSTIGLWLGAGGDGSISPVAAGPSTAAIVIGKNGQRWIKGIQFQSNGLVGTDGAGTGAAIALELARGHRLQWRHSALSGDISGGFYCDNGLKAQATYGVVTLNGFEVHGMNSDQTAEVTLMRVLPNPAAANFIEVRAGSGGGRPNLQMQGADANIDLVITPKGAGIIRPAGNLAPHTTNAHTCGTASNVWSGGFTQTAFTITSDERAKTAPLNITDAMLDAASEVDWVQYQYLDRIEAKGPDGARWHFGAVAQRYVEAFARHGLDAHDYGFICYDEWEALPEVVNTIPAVLGEDGEVVEPERAEVVQEAVEAGARYGIRYEEALALEAALQRRNYQRLIARLDAAGL